MAGEGVQSAKLAVTVLLIHGHGERESMKEGHDQFFMPCPLFSNNRGGGEFSACPRLNSTPQTLIYRGGNISHIVVVKAHTYGYKSTAAARVTYSHKAGSEDTQVTYPKS
jgi:hypothetical protein